MLTRTLRRAIPLLLLAAPAASAQGAPGAADSAARHFLAMARAAHAHLAADAGALWGARLDTIPWMGSRGREVILTRAPRDTAYARAGDGWRGPLPAGIAPANTSVEWDGRRWAMVLLPLPADSAAAVRLLVHEATHVAQGAALPRPTYGETAAGSDLLDGPEGRSWLAMEWRALAAALESRGDARRRALADALLFRARRYAAATPAERARERALDVVEGVPEYTAWRLTGGGAASLVRALREAAPAQPTWVRTFAYHTGPAYAALLDDAVGARWRPRLLRAPDLQRLALELAPALPRDAAAMLRDTNEARAVPATLARLADAAARRYGMDSVRAAEEARWAERARRIAELRRRFVEEPTLRIRPRSLRISFDYRGQTALGDAGTFMPSLAWSGGEGAELRAPGGALVSPDWSELRVPLGAASLEAGPLAAPRAWSGEGWTLTLPAGWVAAPAEGGSWTLAPPEP